MFGNKKKDDTAPPKAATSTGDKPDSDDADDMMAPPLKPFSRKGTHAPAKPPAATAFQPEVPRRVPEIPGAPARRPDRGVGANGDAKRLVVGRDICLSGEITSCDKLVVEGRVEVVLSNARAIDVAPSGYFKGTADVEEAEVSGRYEGELIARDRLTVRTGGRINGTVRYGRIVIESGGEISGDMQTLEQAEGEEPDGGSED